MYLAFVYVTLLHIIAIMGSLKKIEDILIGSIITVKICTSIGIKNK